MPAFIGTSGWSYDHWQGILYPRGVKGLERLDAYAARFRTVEVNNTLSHFAPVRRGLHGSRRASL
jgi:uncharacterized protein YecE (DUF72 family)